MLGWILFGALCAGVIVVAYLAISTIRDKLRQNDFVRASIKKVMRDGSVVHVTMDAFDRYGNREEIEYEADEVDSDIRRGKVIYA